MKLNDCLDLNKHYAFYFYVSFTCVNISIEIARSVKFCHFFVTTCCCCYLTTFLIQLPDLDDSVVLANHKTYSLKQFKREISNDHFLFNCV